MISKFKFDESCPAWSTYPDYNLIFIKAKRNYLADKLCARGYLYLNEIYESFGAEWDPKNDNNVVLYKGGENWDFVLFSEDSNHKNVYLITIQF